MLGSFFWSYFGNNTKNTEYTATGNKATSSNIKHDAKIIRASSASQSTKQPDISRHLRIHGIPNMWNKGFRGQGVKVAVIDAFCDTTADSLQQTQTTDRQKILKHIVRGASSEPHGTLVSSIVAGYDPVRNYTGVAPDAQLVVYSVFVNADNNTSEETALIQTVANIAWALRDCIKEQVDVVNMSFYADDDGSDPKYSDLTAALKEAYEAGIMLVNSMGNSGSYSSTYPACLPYVTAVGAVDYNTIKDRFELASFSSKGWDVSYVGIGEDVIAEQSRGVYVASSGTSFSSPIICGMFALMIQQQRSQLGGRNKKIPIPTLLKLMNETTIDLFSKGKDRKSGYGIPIFGK